MKLARAAQTIPEAVAYSAARRIGDPRPASTAHTAAAPPVVSSAGSQACAVAPGWPPSGSDITRKTASPAEVTPAEAQCRKHHLSSQPQPSDDQREHQLGHQDRLHHRQSAGVQRERLEHERTDHGGHAESARAGCGSNTSPNANLCPALARRGGPSAETPRASDPPLGYRVRRVPCRGLDPALTESAVRQSMSRLSSADASALKALTAERET